MGELSAAIYARVSRDEQRERRSVGEQEKECQKAAAREGWTVDRVFTDNDVSASRYAAKSRRPGYEDLLRYLETAPVGVLVVWEGSRATRRMGEWATLLDLCNDRRIVVHVVSHGRTYDPRHGRDYASLLDDGVDAVRESEKTRDRVSRAMLSNQEEGRPHGDHTYGYRREYNPQNGAFLQQVEDPEQAAIVRECFERVAAGEGLITIARDLNSRGLPTPRQAKRVAAGRSPMSPRNAKRIEAGEEARPEQWNGSTIRVIVRNPAYIGARVVRGEVSEVRAVWPALVDEPLFDRCQTIVADPVRRKAKDITAKHLLSGVARCGRWLKDRDAACWATVTTVRISGTPSYQARNCFHVVAPIAAVDAYVQERVRSALPNFDLARLSGADKDHERRLASDEVKRLTELLQEFEDQALRPAPGTARLSASAWAAVERDIKPRLETAKARSRAREIPVSVERAVNGGWDLLTLAQKREVLRYLFHVVILPVGKGKRVPISSRVLIADRGVGESEAHQTAAHIRRQLRSEWK